MEAVEFNYLSVLSAGTDCENWSRERRLCGITDCDADVILHGNNIADIKNLLKIVRLTRRLKLGMSIQWSITGSKSYVFARIRAFGLDPNTPSSSYSNWMEDQRRQSLRANDMARQEDPMQPLYTRNLVREQWFLGNARDCLLCVRAVHCCQNPNRLAGSFESNGSWETCETVYSVFELCTTARIQKVSLHAGLLKLDGRSKKTVFTRQ